MVLVWIGVYWMWPSSSQETTPRITFEQPLAEPNLNAVAPTTIPPPAHQPTIITQTDPSSTQNQTAPAPAVQSNQPQLIAPEYFEHIVQPNERMQSIAAKYFQSGEDWPIIARANPFVDPQKLKIGMVLRIPKDPGNIQGKVIGRNTPPGVIESHTGAQHTLIEYVVRPGDSLSKIAQRIYGSSRHARYIFDSNRDKLKSIDDISVGQLLKLPPLPDADSP